MTRCLGRLSPGTPRTEKNLLTERSVFLSAYVIPNDRLSVRVCIKHWHLTKVGRGP